MKIFLFLLVSTVLISGSCKDENTEDEILRKIKPKLLVHHFFEAGPGTMSSYLDDFESQYPGKRQQLKNALISYNNCTALMDGSKPMCSKFKTYLLQCAIPITNVIEQCFPEENKAFPDSLVKAITSILEYLCKQDAESIFELTNSCIFEYTQEKMAEVMTKIKGTRSENDKRLKQITKTNPNAREICQVITELQPALELLTKEICESPKTRLLYTGILQAVVDHPCREVLKNTTH